MWGGGREGRGKGLTSSEPDGFHDTHAVFNLAGGSERPAAPRQGALYLQLLKVCSVPVGVQRRLTPHPIRISLVTEASQAPSHMLTGCLYILFLEKTFILSWGPFYCGFLFVFLFFED